MKNKIIYIAVMSVAVALIRVLTSSFNSIETICNVILSFVICYSFIALIKLMNVDTDDEKKKFSICVYILIPILCVILTELIMSLGSQNDIKHIVFGILTLLSVLASLIISLLYLFTRQEQSARIIGLKSSAIFNCLNLVLTSLITTCITLPNAEVLLRLLTIIAGVCIAWFVIGIFGFWAIRAISEKRIRPQ